MNTNNPDTCSICEKRVYVIEKVEANGRMYHQGCFKVNYKFYFIYYFKIKIYDYSANKMVVV
jgi:hypothetical protein